MSRKGVERASFTLHPGGIPHGPHPGTVEASLDAKETKKAGCDGGYFQTAAADRRSYKICG